MKSPIYKSWLKIIYTGIIIALYSCSNQSTQTQQEHSDEHEHEHEQESIVTLSAQQLKTVGITIDTIQQIPIQSTMKTNGVLHVPNNNKASASPIYSGVIKTLDVALGDHVKKGQRLATITNPEFIQLQQEYLSTQSSIAYADKEYTRQNELFQGNIGAKKNLERATAELNSLRTRRSSLARQIQLMGINPSTLSNENLQTTLTVKSPINGIVSSVFAKIGSYMDASTPVAEIIDNSALHADLQVYEQDIPSFKVDQKIRFLITNNPSKPYTAVVYNIGSSFDDQSKTIAVHSRVIGDKTGLIDGMNITAVVNLGGALSTAVPNEAIVNANGKYYIFILKEHQETSPNQSEHEAHTHEDEKEHQHEDEQQKGFQFEKIEVSTGATELGYTAITAVKELDQNTQVVVKGAFFVEAKMSNAGEGHVH